MIVFVRRFTKHVARSIVNIYFLPPSFFVFIFFAAFVYPANASLPQQTSVTKDGITWTFDRAVAVGQFINGDYYVIGPVTVTAIDPPPTTSTPFENGSVLNLPTPDNKSGFDERLNDGVDESWWFNANWRVYPPIVLKAGDSLVSSISLSESQLHTIPEVMRSGDVNISPVRTVSILTVLNAPVSSDAFRPSYCDRNQAIYDGSTLQRNLLPSLASPNPAETPPLSQFESWLRRPWIDTNPFLFDVPAEYMPSYGQHIAFVDSYVGLLLSLDFTPDEKINLTNYFVQYGIDLFGCVQAGYGWPAFGGHRSGRKMPILFAGILLNNESMKNVSTLYPDKFGEDMQTVYINELPPAGTYQQAWQGAKVVYGGHYGVHSDGTPVSPGLYGPYEQLQPSNWPLYGTPPNQEQLGEAYRRCCTSVSWIGEALTMHFMRAEDIWDHPAFFDYTDRWMSEDDAQSITEIYEQTNGNFDYSADWERQGQTRYWLQGEFPQYTFIDDMWHDYRGVHLPPQTIVPAGSGGGCFIATAVFGSSLDPHVVTLKKFRDKSLLTNSLGREFVKVYYRYSPLIAQRIRDNEALRFFTWISLISIVFFIEYPMLIILLFSLLIGIVAYKRNRSTRTNIRQM